MARMILKAREGAPDSDFLGLGDARVRLDDDEAGVQTRIVVEKPGV